MNNIQRKFLVSADIRRWLKKYTPSIHKTEQFYTVSNAQETCYYHGNKESVAVSEEEYTSQRKNNLGRIIVKKAYTVIMDGSTFVVEKYLKKLEGLYILITYFEDEKVFRNSKTIQACSCRP